MSEKFSFRIFPSVCHTTDYCCFHPCPYLTKYLHCSFIFCENFCSWFSLSMLDWPICKIMLMFCSYKCLFCVLRGYATSTLVIRWKPLTSSLLAYLLLKIKQTMQLLQHFASTDGCESIKMCSFSLYMCVLMTDLLAELENGVIVFKTTWRISVSDIIRNGFLSFCLCLYCKGATGKLWWCLVQDWHATLPQS